MLSLSDSQKEIDFSLVNKYYLLSADEDTRIRVNSNVTKYPSLRKRCQLTGNTVTIKLDTDNTDVICGIANLCSNYNTQDRMGNIMSFIEYTCDDELLKRLLQDMKNLKMVTSEVCNEPDPVPEESIALVDVEGTDIKFVPFSDSLLETTKEDKDNFQETLTPEQCRKLPLHYLLTHPHRCKYAFSHPNMFNVDLDTLGCAIANMWNKELEFVNTGKGDLALFTNEFENLPRFNVKMNEESPYKLDIFGNFSSVLLGKDVHHKPPNYQTLINKIKRVVAHNNIVKRFLVEGYGVISGNYLSSLAFHTHSNITLCLTDKSKLKDALSLFADYKRKDQLDRQHIIFTNNYGSIILYIPNISHVHYTASSPYSTSRMFFDGEEVYMTLSCMLSWVNDGFVTIYPWKCNSVYIRSLINSGFSFSTADVKEVIGDEIQQHTNIPVVKYRNSIYFKGYDDENYLMNNISFHDVIYC